MKKKAYIYVAISMLIVGVVFASINSFQKNKPIKELKLIMASFEPSKFSDLDRYEISGKLNEHLTLYTSDANFDTLTPRQKSDKISGVAEEFNDLFYANYFKFGLFEEDARLEVSVITPENKVTTYDAAGTMETGGEMYFREDLYKSSENSSIEPKEDASSNNDDVVYQYIMSQFDAITNEGDNYVPEVHDPVVMTEAAEHFSMSVEEVNEIFMRAAASQ